MVVSRKASHRKKTKHPCILAEVGEAEQRHRPLISIPLTPFSRGHIRACGLSIAAGLPCPPTPARHLMMPYCSFWTVTGQQQQGCLREDLPPSALEGGACEAGGPGPHGGFLLQWHDHFSQRKFSPHHRHEH